jgi:hypothetical protein
MAAKFPEWKAISRVVDLLNKADDTTSEVGPDVNPNSLICDYSY